MASSEPKLFGFSPKMSYMAPEIVARDPLFWGAEAGGGGEPVGGAAGKVGLPYGDSCTRRAAGFILPVAFTGRHQSAGRAAPTCHRLFAVVTTDLSFSP
jgi:hypothetical protein